MSRLAEVALTALKYEARRALLGVGAPAFGLDEPSEDILSVVRAASGLVAGEQAGSGGSGMPSGRFLRSIFDCISLSDQEQNGKRLVYAPVEYGVGGPASHSPRLETELSDVRAAEGIAEKLKGLADTDDPDTALNLLERYGSYLPSPANQEGVSLFDHAKATAAIAVCTAVSLDEAGKSPGSAALGDPYATRFLFVRGDISGVQKFIYTITSKGALRMLRARSFYLELVAEHAVAQMLRRCGVPRTNVIYVGGGGFQVLLPNTGGARAAVEAAGGELNEVMAESFGRDLYLTLADVPCAASGIAGDGLRETLGELGWELSNQKARKHHKDLHRLFDTQPEPEPESCDVCTRDDVPVKEYDPRGYEAAIGQATGEDGEESLKLCWTCHMLARASRKLVSGHYLVEGGGDLRVGDIGYGLSETSRRAAYALDGIEDEACLDGAVPLPAARYAMRDEEQRDQIMDFGKLAERSRGAQRVAVLRMDVDNLGEIFRSGLPQEMRTFDRYAALSRAFTTFFKTVVPKICAGGYENSLRLFGEGRERAATVVYSGGDDLFIVGAWSDVLELAVDVRRAFRQFVGENPSVTLSGGVSIHTAGEPLYMMAEQAGAAEEIAKGNERNGRKKDSAVLFYRGSDYRTVDKEVPEALFWDEVEDGVLDLLEQINEFRRDGELPFPRGFTRMLMDVVDVYEQEGHLSLPRLAYALARMEESGKLKDDERWKELKEELLKVETVKKYLRPAAYWLDLAERKGE